MYLGSLRRQEHTFPFFHVYTGQAAAEQMLVAMGLTLTKLKGYEL